MRKLRSVFTLSLLAVTATVWANDEVETKAAASVVTPAKEARANTLTSGAATPFQAFGGEAFGGPLYIYNWSSPSLVTTFPTPVGLSAGRFAISPDSSRLFVSDNHRSDQVMVYNTSLSPIITFDSMLNAGGRTSGLAAGPSGRFLYVATGDSSATYALTVIDLMTPYPIRSIPLHARPNSVAVTPNDSYVVVTLVTPEVAVINIGNTLAAHGFPTYVQLSAATSDVAISPDSKRAVVPGPGQGVTNVNLTPGFPTTFWSTSMPSPSCGPSSVAFSPGGTRLYLACLSENSYRIIRGPTGTFIASGGFPPSPFPFMLPGSVRVTPDGKAAWFHGEPLPGYVNIWVLDTATLTFPTSLNGPEHSSQETVFGGPFYEVIDPAGALTSFTGAREAAPAACAAGQIFKVTSTWKNNTSTKIWSEVLAEVGTLTGGNTLVSQTWAPAEILPGGGFTGVFSIRLNSCAPFSFLSTAIVKSRSNIKGNLARADEPILPELEPGREEDTAPWLLDPQ